MNNNELTLNRIVLDIKSKIDEALKISETTIKFDVVDIQQYLLNLLDVENRIIEILSDNKADKNQIRMSIVGLL